MRKMFKTSSFEEDLAQGMQEKLVASQNEKQFNFDRIAKAADFLNAASEIFDDTGFFAEAEILTRMLEKLAGKKMNKRASWEELSPEEVEFYRGLSDDDKRELKGLVDVGELPDGNADYARMVDKIKDMHAEKKHKKVPNLLEFESLLPKSEPMIEMPEDEVIEFSSIAMDKKKATRR